MNRSMPLARRSWLALAAVVALGGVGPTVASAEETQAGACANLSGCWDCGYWKSYCNSHHGKLRAKVSCCGSNYQVTWSGTFFGVIPFRYTQQLIVTGCKDGVTYFRASRNLPMFGGTFCMTGSATACKLTAHYTSPKDRGVFVLTR